jgi:hypothetical protein
VQHGTSDQRGEETKLLERDTACSTQGVQGTPFAFPVLQYGTILSTVVVISATDAIHTNPNHMKRGKQNLTGYIG